MRIDTYTKAVLTIIAVALVWIAARERGRGMPVIADDANLPTLPR